MNVVSDQALFHNANFNASNVNARHGDYRKQRPQTACENACRRNNKTKKRRMESATSLKFKRDPEMGKYQREQDNLDFLSPANTNLHTDLRMKWVSRDSIQNKNHIPTSKNGSKEKNMPKFQRLLISSNKTQGGNHKNSKQSPQLHLNNKTNGNLVRNCMSASQSHRKLLENANAHANIVNNYGGFPRSKKEKRENDNKSNGHRHSALSSQTKLSLSNPASPLPLKNQQSAAFAFFKPATPNMQLKYHPPTFSAPTSPLSLTSRALSSKSINNKFLPLSAKRYQYFI